MARVVIVPGIGNSGPEHWQSLWQARGADFVRIRPSSWDEPQRDDWLSALDTAIAGEDSVLVAHSLGCLAVAHWATTRHRRIAGALLVAVPDPSSASFPAVASSFAQPPLRPFSFPSIVVASSNDPYASLEHAHNCAQAWRSRIVEAGPLGHLNAASGLGEWPDGQGYLVRLVANRV